MHALHIYVSGQLYALVVLSDPTLADQPNVAALHVLMFSCSHTQSVAATSCPECSTTTLWAPRAPRAPRAPSNPECSSTTCSHVLTPRHNRKFKLVGITTENACPLLQDHTRSSNTQHEHACPLL
jgi:hypothetical protein